MSRGKSGGLQRGEVPLRTGPAQQLTSLQIEQEFYRGLLPHPKHLKEYADLYPDAPQIIFEQFREQGNHRRSIEKLAVTKQERRADFGVWFALVLGLALITSGTLAISFGHPYEGAGLISATLVGLVGNFIYGSQGRRAERIAKTAMLVNPERPAHLPTNPRK